LEPQADCIVRGTRQRAAPGQRSAALGAELHSSGSQRREDIALRSDIERKRLLVEAKTQGADEGERENAHDRAAEEPSPLAMSGARPEETGKAACDRLTG
jgi:hypothetical protein